MTFPIRAAALAALLATAPAAAESPASPPVLTALVKAQIALEEGALVAAQAAMDEAYLAARVLAEKGAKPRSLDAIATARMAAVNAADLVATAVGLAGACRVRTGFDGGACSTKANEALALVHAPAAGTVGVTSFDSQAKVTAALIRAFGTTVEPALKSAIAAAKEDGS